MFSTLFTISGFQISTFPVVFVLALLFGAFLFWRACRHELIESIRAFDLIIVSLAGAFVGGRFFEFVVNWQVFNWSFKKLIFFNVYPGLDFYGAMLGGVIAIFIFSQKARVNFWQVLDLAAAPVVFAQMIVAVGLFARNSADNNFIYLIYAAFYFVIFWSIKRLAKFKRHSGFFICFYFVGVSFADLLFLKLRPDVIYIMRSIPYQGVMSAGILIASVVMWHKLAGRKLLEDAKGLFAFILLSLFRLMRMIRDVEEAGKFAKTIVFAPLWLGKSLYFLFKMLAREIFLGFADFLYVLGNKKIR